MKITCIDADDLASYLKKFDLIKQTYSQQSECVSITTGENDFTLATTDGLVSLSTIIPCFVESPGSLTITCKQLSKLLEAVPAKEVELTGLENRLQIKTVTGEYLLHTTNLEAKETTFRVETSLNIEGKILLDGINYTHFSASTDETKRSICGVNLQTDGVLNRFCSCHGHTLATYEVDGEISNLESDFLITNKAYRLLSKLLSPQDQVSINLGKESYIDPESEETVTHEVVIINFGHTTLKYSLYGVGMFPRYDQLIPRQFERKVLVERLALITAIENIAVIAQQKNNVVKLAISQENQEIRLSCECSDVGASEITIPAQISGDNLTYAFNLTYLLGGLKALNSTEIKLNLNAALSPVIIEPLSVQKRKFLIMPVELRG